MLHTITKGDVLEWWQSRAEGKTNRGSLRSLASLNRELNILGGLFAAAVERGYIKTNPCDGIKRHKVDDKGRIVVLEEDAEKKLFAALTGAKEKFKPVVILALNTGLRLKEVTGLRWDQVTLSDNEDEREITVLGKGDKWRTIPLNDVAYGVLKELRSKSNGKGPVFSERGLTKTNVGHQIANICDEIGLPNITMHVMRHTFASVPVRRGDVNPEQLRKLMGHSNLRITQRYFHLQRFALGCSGLMSICSLL
jgi:integrase